MTDIREQMLVRMHEIGFEIEGITLAFRNQDTISETTGDVLAMFDGDEIADENDPKFRQAGAPRRVLATPEYRILLQGLPEAVGSKLNLYRARLIKAVVLDSQLIALTADRQGARYMGAASQLKAGRSMQGDMLCVFGLPYYLKPNDL